ncbi:MAG: hypothetical protein LBD96_00770 [Treponema sp.]|jgi:hypothetical protein|nr:hypothetical protein [Treponema sp.]
MTVQVIFSLATLLLCAVFFVYAHIYIRRQTSRESIMAAYREEVSRLIAEIDHATDRDTQLVEERITALRKILEEADHRIALMSRDMEKRRSATELYTALGTRQPAPAASPPAEQAVNSFTPAAQPLPGQALPSQPLPGQALTGQAPTGQATNRQTPDGAPSLPTLSQRVLELSRQGFAEELIATRLGLSRAEVELTLAVSRRTGH